METILDWEDGPDGERSIQTERIILTDEHLFPIQVKMPSLRPFSFDSVLNKKMIIRHEN